MKNKFKKKKESRSECFNIRVDFRARNITTDREDYFLMIKRSIKKEDIIILNICAPNNRASNYTKENLIEQQGNPQIHNYC